ncbi:MAG: hypothetical protein Q8L84_02995 [Hyphomonas sp.]|nr:hypothetical protein [Hyphomonas sp.]
MQALPNNDTCVTFFLAPCPSLQAARASRLTLLLTHSMRRAGSGTPAARTGFGLKVKIPRRTHAATCIRKHVLTGSSAARRAPLQRDCPD